ncbi:hypothetical protein [Streptomyces galbus]|uniref:DUF3159 domain-containing protein n=1 Tax=Streptomyces galbus TaxID=33898 RepID=A0ABX1IHY0_STRGB|nr:hypothetical protein [Streptomyces galbus]NKQ25261.1 hypothetical protein [Streptomyces galbus]
MKTPTLLLAFLPLITFSVLARVLPSHAIGVAALAAVLAALIALAADRPPWPPKILTACSLVLFAVLAVLGFALVDDRSRLATWGGAGVGIVLGLAVLALVPVMPFTMQFARQTVPSPRWHTPSFRRINRVLSTAWGLALVALGVSRTAAAAADGHRAVEVVFGAVVPVLIIVYMLKFSRTYPDRVMSEQTDHAPAASQAGHDETAPPGERSAP